MESGNEVLINLDNHVNLEDSELIGGLINLAHRSKGMYIDWNEHSIVKKCLQDLKSRQPKLSSMHIA